METSDEPPTVEVPEDKPIQPKCHMKKKCIWTGDSGVGSKILFPCEAGNCPSCIHAGCYEKYIQNKDIGVPLPPVNDYEGNIMYFCRKTCYTIGKKKQDRETSDMYKLPWDGDGAKGPSDPNHSQAILLNWWTTEGNYSSFRQNVTGTTKAQVANQIIRRLTAAKVRCPRTQKDVLNKIRYIEQLFRGAHEFANTETGAGLQEDDPKTFEEAVKKKCLFYFDLLEVMKDRASTQPMITNEKNMNAKATIENRSDAEETVATVPLDPEVFVLDTPVLLSKKNTSSTAKKDGAKRTKPASGKRESLKKKKSGPSAPPEMKGLIDIMEIGSLTEDRAVAETERHNRFLEETSRAAGKKAEVESKKVELEYKLKLLESYHDLKERGFDHVYIAAVFPEMIQIFPAEEQEKHDGKAAAKPTAGKKKTKEVPSTPTVTRIAMRSRSALKPVKESAIELNESGSDEDIYS